MPPKMRNKQENKNEEILDDENSNEINNEISTSNKNIPEYIKFEKMMLEKIYNASIVFISFSAKTIVFVFKVSGIYLLWICLHYFSAHLYIKFCVPSTVYGFLMSPFMIATPHCQGLRWIVYNAAGIINNMWILIGAWIYSLIWIFNKDAPIDSVNL